MPSQSLIFSTYSSCYNWQNHLSLAEHLVLVTVSFMHKKSISYALIINIFGCGGLYLERKAKGQGVLTWHIFRTSTNYHMYILILLYVC